MKHVRLYEKQWISSKGLGGFGRGNGDWTMCRPNVRLVHKTSWRYLEF